MPVDGLILLGTSLRMLYVAMLQSIHHGHITIFILAENKKIAISLYTASNLCLLLQKEQNVKGGEGPSGKQAVGINNGTR